MYVLKETFQHARNIQMARFVFKRSGREARGNQNTGDKLLRHLSPSLRGLGGNLIKTDVNQT